MARSPHYYTLMASLPALPPRFASERTPISRRRLEQRLAMLEPDDARELSELEALMFWYRLPLESTDREIVERAERVVPRVRSDVLRKAARWRIELRTVVAALRRRAAGESAPEAGEPWGWGRQVRRIRQEWNRPDFGLAVFWPEIAEWRQLLEQGDALGMERSLSAVIWDRFGKLAAGHHFDFEAVAFYVLRWDVIHRWVAHDERAALERFNGLVEDGLGPHARLFDAGTGERSAESS
jgi:hypothetical protein